MIAGGQAPRASISDSAGRQRRARRGRNIKRPAGQAQARSSATRASVSHAAGSASAPTSPGARSRRPRSWPRVHDFGRRCSTRRPRPSSTAANSFDYILKEVLFIMPGRQGQRASAPPRPTQYNKSVPRLRQRRAAVAELHRRRGARRRPPPRHADSRSTRQRARPSSTSAASPSRAWSRTVCRCWPSALEEVSNRHDATSPRTIRQDSRQSPGCRPRPDKYLAGTEGQGRRSSGANMRSARPDSGQHGRARGHRTGPHPATLSTAGRAQSAAVSRLRATSAFLAARARRLGLNINFAQTNDRAGGRASFRSPCRSSTSTGSVPDKPGDTSPLSGKVVIEAISRAVERDARGPPAARW